MITPDAYTNNVLDALIVYVRGPDSPKLSNTHPCKCAAGIIPCSDLPRTSNHIIQKGLAFVRERSGTVAVPGNSPFQPAAVLISPRAWIRKAPSVGGAFLLARTMHVCAPSISKAACVQSSARLRNCFRCSSVRALATHRRQFHTCLVCPHQYVGPYERDNQNCDDQNDGDRQRGGVQTFSGWIARRHLLLLRQWPRR